MATENNGGEFLKKFEKDVKQVVADFKENIGLPNEDISNAKEVPVGTLVGNMDEKRSQILKLFGSREEEMDEAEAEDLDVQIMDAILEHLSQMGFEEEIENMALLMYEKEEVENREIVYEDAILALTLDYKDEETGTKTYGAWIKV